MEDRIATVLGTQAGDGEVKSNIRPVWYLDPLPLAHVQDHAHAQDPDWHPQRAHPKSDLVTLCVYNISQNFHLYSPQYLSDLGPVLLSRVLLKVRQDRRYGGAASHIAQPNPDQATIWAYSALTNAEADDTEKDHVLAIPQESTLVHLEPNPHADTDRRDHPLVRLPKLYERINTSPLSLLTTLSLDGIDHIVNDRSILNLKFCTHLTALWTRGCSISDLGVRMLASSLDLGEKRGMCSLRAWFAPDCKGITDRSMRFFAKWPGLTCLDVRETSVTEVGMHIFNRYSRAVFDSLNADFQPCPDGLASLFAGDATVAQVVEGLALTLLKPHTPPTRDLARWWLALHVVPSRQPVDPAYLPHRPRQDSTKRACSLTSRYFSEYGQVYGTGVYHMQDTVQTFRRNLRTAIRIEDEYMGLSTPSDPPWVVEVREHRKQRREEDKKFRSMVKSRRGKRPVPRGKGAKRKGEAEKNAPNAKLNIERDGRFMLVRMVHEQWQDLQWSSRVASSTSCQNPALSATPAIARTSSANLLGDILDTQMQVHRTRPSSLSQISSSWSPSPSQPLPPSWSPDNKPTLPDTPIKTPSRHNPFKTCSNPFKQPKGLETDQLGVRPLYWSVAEQKPFASAASQPLSSKQPPILIPSTPRPTLSQSSLSFGSGRV